MSALRNRFATLLLVFISATAGTVQAQEGLIAVPSPHDVATTIDRLQAVLEEKGMTIMGRVDHAANAAQSDLELRPTQVLIFGNPAIGTPLMNCAQSVAIDLPQKMLAWQDADGQVFLGYNDPEYLKQRHGVDGCDEVLVKVAGALGNFAKAATQP